MCNLQGKQEEMPLTTPPKSHFFGESTFTLGVQVAITLAPDRPNELKCFNIAFGGGDCRIQITPWRCKITPWAGCQNFYARKSATN